MHMVRLIYVSRMTENCDMEALQKILKTSRKNNKARDITGILCYDPAFFMQCLEGPRTAVNGLYSAILKDSRHTDVVLLEYCEPSERMFAEWSMAFVAAEEIPPGTLRKYAVDGQFNPHSLRATEACEFLRQIASHIAK